MRKKRFVGIAVAAALAVSALGVGTASAASKAKLNVVHGIPGVDVNVCVNRAEAIPDFNQVRWSPAWHSRPACTTSRSSPRPTTAA